MADLPEQPQVAQLEDREIREQLERIENKPPMYRAFRVTLYSLYLAIATWLVVSIAIGAWKSVYGPAGVSLKARAATQSPLAASPRTQP